MTLYADRTNYPHIYSKVYWGNFSGNHLTEETIQHRNEFINDFGIKEKCRKPPCYLLEFVRRTDANLFDHIEFYETKDNKYVVLNSPYRISPENEAKLNEMGFSKYKQMYSCDATTFAIVLDKKKKKIQ